MEWDDLREPFHARQPRTYDRAACERVQQLAAQLGGAASNKLVQRVCAEELLMSALPALGVCARKGRETQNCVHQACAPSLADLASQI
jgi:hypothetical protein